MDESFSWSCGASSSSAGAFQGSDYYEDLILASCDVRSYNGSASSSSLVLDSARGELVEAPARSEAAKVAAPERSLEALKNHSEAEKRRRARINAHFDTLRGLIPGAKKMDKASLLSEVINHLKDLKRKASEASEDFVIPKDIDEVKVEQLEDYQLLEGRPNYSIRVSLSCDYRPGLLSDLKRALEALHLMMMKAEIATLGRRMKNVFVMTACQEESLVEDDEVLRARSVCHAVRSVIDNASASDEFLRTTLSNKRRRVSMFGP